MFLKYKNYLSLFSEAMVRLSGTGFEILMFANSWVAQIMGQTKSTLILSQRTTSRFYVKNHINLGAYYIDKFLLWQLLTYHMHFEYLRIFWIVINGTAIFLNNFFFFSTLHLFGCVIMQASRHLCLTKIIVKCLFSLLATSCCYWCSPEFPQIISCNISPLNCLCKGFPPKLHAKVSPLKLPAKVGGRRCRQLLGRILDWSLPPLTLRLLVWDLDWTIKVPSCVSQIFSEAFFLVVALRNVAGLI